MAAPAGRHRRRLLGMPQYQLDKSGMIAPGLPAADRLLLDCSTNLNLGIKFFIYGGSPFYNTFYIFFVVWSEV